MSIVIKAISLFGAILIVVPMVFFGLVALYRRLFHL